MPAPIFGEGTVLDVDDGDAAAFAAVDGATEITPPNETQVEVERNRLSATTIVERAFSSRRDPGQFSFTYECDKTGFQRVEALKGVDHAWRLTYTDDLRLAYSGRVLSNVPQNVQGGVITSAQCTVRLTSLVAVSDAGS
jgi:hypothetical protein